MRTTNYNSAQLDADTKAFQQWAYENYERGADFYVECCTTAEIQKFIRESGSLNKALGIARRICGINKDRRADAKNSTF